MRIYLNDEIKELDDGSSILQLLEGLGLRLERVAVELNRSVVRRGDWAATILKDGDKLEVVHFVGGG